MIRAQEHGLQTILETSEPVFCDTLPDVSHFLPKGRRGQDWEYEPRYNGSYDYYKKSLASSVLSDYVLPEDILDDVRETMKLIRKFPTTDEKSKMRLNMELAVLDEKDEIYRRNYFFESLTEKNKLLIKHASMTELFLDKGESYYTSLFGNVSSLPIHENMCIALTAILNGQTVTETLKQYTQRKMHAIGEDWKRSRYPFEDLRQFNTERSFCLQLNIVNPTSCRVREAVPEYCAFRDYIKSYLAECIDVSFFIHAHRETLYLAQAVNVQENKTEFSQKASDFLARADELVHRINSDANKFSALQNLTLSPDRLYCYESKIANAAN